MQVQPKPHVQTSELMVWGELGTSKQIGQQN